MSHDASAGQLIARAVGGEQLAFEELLLRHYDRLAAMLAGRIPSELRSTVAPEDVLQEAFADAALRIGQLKSRDDAGFFAWLASIAEHRLIDCVRARRALKRGGGSPGGAAAVNGSIASITDLLALVATPERSPSHSAAMHEAASALAAALERIGADQRCAVRMRYMEGLPVAQIASRMNRTEPAVHMLLHRGLASLRAELGSSSQFFSRKE